MGATCARMAHEMEAASARMAHEMEAASARMAMVEVPDFQA